MQISARLALLGIVAGCASAAGYVPPAGRTAYGAYPFKQVITQATPQIELNGTVIILPDSAVVTMNGKGCAYQPAGRSYGYFCGDIAIFLDRANPLRSNYYQTSTLVWRMERVCKEYKTNPQTMAEYCSKYTSERVEGRQMLSGRLAFVQR